jgi:hypothetical protein
LGGHASAAPVIYVLRRLIRPKNSSIYNSVLDFFIVSCLLVYFEVEMSSEDGGRVELEFEAMAIDFGSLVTTTAKVSAAQVEVFHPNERKRVSNSSKIVVLTKLLQSNPKSIQLQSKNRWKSHLSPTSFSPSSSFRPLHSRLITETSTFQPLFSAIAIKTQHQQTESFHVFKMHFRPVLWH